MARTTFKLSPAVSLVLASALWAIATVISKQLLNSVPPVTLLVVQLVPSVVVLWLLVFASRRLPTHWRGLLPIALFGLLNPGLSYTLSMLGLAQTTASVATLLWAFEPALIVAMAWLFLREPITPQLVALTAMAAAGVLLVSGLLSSSDLHTGSARGAALILGGVLCCALYTVVSRGIALTTDPLLTITLQQTTGLLFAAAIWFFELRDGTGDQFQSLTQREVISGALSGLMYYAAAFWLYLNGLRSLPASTTGLFINLTPVFGVAAAYAFLGEQLNPVQWAGAGLVLISVVALIGSIRADVVRTPR